MEMQSSRRSLDRSRVEPGAKRARLAEDPRLDRDHQFNQRASVGGVAAGPLVSSRGRVAEREDPIRAAGPTYTPQYQQEEQEIVAQYRAALAELTFNSKPIITNLTIISGENVPASKGIVAAICTNIVEVPTEQKLPSLYLLDSIVKNIGKDYIRYFAARLPEVFCKAYRQVDSSTHPAMRHLFGTWKGVFPPATLQTIDKELGFTLAANGSSSAVARPDSQSQRTPHSIHVNPKYLEARQRLQQSSRAKGVSGEGDTAAPNETTDRLDNAAASGSTRTWDDKHRTQRGRSSEPLHGKNLGSGYGGDDESATDLPRQTGYVGKGGEKFSTREVLDKPSWYGANASTPNKPGLSQVNGFDPPHAYKSYRDPRSVLANRNKHLGLTMTNRISSEATENWKNSEEEEYMWDNMHSRIVDTGCIDSSKRDSWGAESADKPVKTLRESRQVLLDAEIFGTSHRNILDTSRMVHPSSKEERIPLQNEGNDCLPLSHALEEVGPKASREFLRESLSDGKTPLRHKVLPYDGLNNKDIASQKSEVHPSLLDSGLPTMLQSSLNKLGLHAYLEPTVGSSPSHGENIAAKISGPNKTFRPAATPSLHERPYSLSSNALSTEDLPQIQPFPQPGQKSFELTEQTNWSSRAEIAKDSSTVVSQNQLQSNTLPRGLSSYQVTNSISTQTTGSLESFKQRASIVDILGQTGTNSLFTAIMKGPLSDKKLESAGLADLSKPDVLPMNKQPIVPCGPCPTLLTESISVAEVSSSADVASPAAHRQKAVQPPLPPGLPPPSTLVGTSQAATTSGAVPNPLTNLLSSLVAKGLIAASATDLQALSGSQSSTQLDTVGTTKSSSLPTRSSSEATVSIQLSGTKNPDPVSVAKSTLFKEKKDLIGTEFRSEIIRERHPVVISGLLDDLPHQCHICGLRLRLKELHDRHMDEHALKKRELIGCSRVSRKWFVSYNDWVDGNEESSSGSIANLMEDAESTEGDCEPMVPADEARGICILCGEPFEDWYSEERDEWMYKSAVYMPIPIGESDTENTDAVAPIVHASCI